MKQDTSIKKQNDLEDLQLAKNVKDNKCNESLSLLVNRHTPLYLKICQRFAHVLSAKGVFVEDVFNDNFYVIYKAANSFNFEKKIKVSTWIGLYAKYHCLSLLTKFSNNVQTVSNELSTLNFSYHEQDSNTKDYILNVLSRFNDKRLEEIFKLRYFTPGNNTWKNIGRKLNLSNQTVINLHAKALVILKEKLKKQDYNDAI